MAELGELGFCMNNVGRVLLFVGWCCSLPGGLNGADPVLKVSVRGRELTGRVVSQTASHVWFQSREGRLDNFPVDWVSEYRELSAAFRPAKAADVKAALTRELGDQYQVAWSGPYVVAGRNGMAERYAGMFDELSREFRLFFSTRGFRLGEPEFPLVAICFATQAEFQNYCREEQARIAGPVVGVYLLGSNRVALYEQPESAAVDATIIHEATHQLAYNLGVHSRIGPNPRWVVEGLAEVFENGSFRRRHPADQSRDRANLPRLRHFVRTYLPKRPEKAYEELAKSDELFRTSALDAYSESWALSFFLAETRPTRYSAYLRQIASRDPTVAYPPEDRLNDFQSAFAGTAGLLDAEFRRFVQELDR